MTSLDEVPRADAKHEARTRHVAGRHRVNELRLRDGVGQHRGKVGNFHAHGLRVESRAHRVLHPAVRDQDPQCRQVGTERHQPGDHQVLHLRHAFPTEEEQANEGGFQEERHQPFDRQRRTKHIADVLRVVRPVGAELELHGDARRDTECEVDAEQLAPELHHLFVDGIAGHHVNRFHDRQQRTEAQRQRHEQEVVEHGDRELPARQLDNGIGNHA